MNNFLQNSANQNTKQTTSTATPSQTPPTPSTSSSSSNSERNNGKNSDNSANLKLSDAVKTELLQHYQVNDFSSIKNVSPKDMAGHISNILDSGSNQVVVILDLKYSDTSRSEVKNCVASLLKVLKDKLHNLGGIVVATSDNYYTERAKK